MERIHETEGVAAQMKKLFKRYKRWKVWCHYSKNTKIQKILILLRLKKNLWFENFMIGED